MEGTTYHLEDRVEFKDLLSFIGTKPPVVSAKKIMKIAIIEEDQNQRMKLQSLISGHEWIVNFFRTPKDFGKADLSEYDVVVADCSLPTMRGRDLLKSISGKTHAQMLLMGSAEVFSQEDIENENINGLIDKPEDLIDHLNYLDSKIRINNLMAQESDRINGILSNGFSLSIKDEIAIVEIKSLPVESTLNRMEKEITELRLKGAIVCFKETFINSRHLGILISLYKRLKAHKIRIAFWNKSGDPHIEHMMRNCNLDQLYGIYSDLDQAFKSFT